MGEIAEFRTTIRLSISQIASEFGMSRNTVAKRIDLFGVKPDGRRAGYPVYRMRDLVPVVAQQQCVPAGPDFNPDTLPPIERRAWFQSENERLKVEGEMGRLIPAAEVESEMAAMAKSIVRVLETLPDMVERDIRASPEVVEYLQEKVYELRLHLTGEVAEVEEDDVRVGG